MKKENLKLFISALLLSVFIFTLGGCGQIVIYSYEKESLIPGKELTDANIRPDEAFYDLKGNSKLAVSFYSEQTRKKQLKFYDIATDKPALLYKTGAVKDIYRPVFGANKAVYGVMEGKVWKVMGIDLGAANKAAKELLTLDNLNAIVVAGDGKTYTIGRKNNQLSIYENSSSIFNANVIEDLNLDAKGELIYKFLDKDGAWFVSVGGQKSEPYNMISRVAVSETGEVGYLAKDKDNNWLGVAGGMPTKLGKDFDEIGKVLTKNGKVFFSAREKGKSTWGIYKNSRILIEDLVDVPEFAVTSGGDVAYAENKEEGERYVANGYVSPFFMQVSQLLESGEGSIFAKVKDQHSLWNIVEENNQSTKYVWMSKLFLNGNGEVIAVGMDSYNEMETLKFSNKK